MGSQNDRPSVPAPKWDAIKAVIDGKLYNTETATFIHEPSDDTAPNRRVEQMYRTRLGEFFLVVRNEQYWNPAIQEADLQDRIFPLEPEQAIKWMKKHCNDKITGHVDVPEAGESSTTLTLRLDKGLKVLLESAAAKNSMSLSLWCVQALQAAVNAGEETHPIA